MGFLVKRICFLVGFFSVIYAEIQNEPVILLSFPRSGNTWIRYCIEYITKRPTGNPYTFAKDPREKSINSPLGNSFDLGVNLKKPIVIKDHGCGDFPLNEANYLIFVVRDYKECLIRNTVSYQAALDSLLEPNSLFMNNIKIYDRWDSKKRLFLYYEDIITNLEASLLKIADFFQEGHENIQPFLDDIERHKKNALEIYDQAGGSVTKGKDLHFHANKLTQFQRLQLDEACENNDPELYQKYLIKYKEGF
jgi:hypothetical protein